MATVEIEINCLCLFVPDPESQTVHVLMPNTHHAGTGRGIPHHVVHVLHPSFPPRGRSMDGFDLILGRDSVPASADTSLVPRETGPHREEIAPLGELAGLLDRALVDDTPEDSVGARIILRAGRVRKLKADAKWRLHNRKVAMAHRVTWRIEDFPEDGLWWRPRRSGVTPPFGQLSDLKRKGQDLYRFEIFHVPPDALPPTGSGTLDPEEVRKHFRAFYHLHGVGSPSDDKLPQDPEVIPQEHEQRDVGLADNLNCPTASGTLRPKP